AGVGDLAGLEGHGGRYRSTQRRDGGHGGQGVDCEVEFHGETSSGSRMVRGKGAHARRERYAPSNPCRRWEIRVQLLLICVNPHRARAGGRHSTCPCNLEYPPCERKW